MVKRKKSRKNKNSNKWIYYLVLIITILIVLNTVSFLVQDDEDLIEDEEFVESEEDLIDYNETNISEVHMKVPAVSSEREGVSTVLKVESREGTGRTLVDIENILFWADTQQSIRLARLVAEDITGANSSKYDITYSIEADSPAIGGPSAGAALAIATIGVLIGEKPREDIMITGRINHDGTLGPASAILEKAKASKDAGANIFLVPLKGGRDVIYEVREHCEDFGTTEICWEETIPRRVDIREEIGIPVEEVLSVQEAMEYFFD